MTLAKEKSGFTIVELLIVIVVIGILASLTV
jgi:prepilin-type N-terminal cleavage/methylation domain-containing protein